jgi:hypothetical protein
LLSLGELLGIGFANINQTRKDKGMAKTVVGLMNTREEAWDVIQELVDKGFSREDISMMARDQDNETRSYTGTETESSTLEGAGKGAAIGGTAGLLVGIAALAIPGVGPIVAAGPLATALTGLGIGAAAGGIIGALANIGVPEDEAGYYAEGVRRGGVLVTVSASEAQAERAAQIMRQHGAVDIEKRAASWKESGWDRFDESRKPLTSEELARERDSFLVGSEATGVRSTGARRAAGTERMDTADMDSDRWASDYTDTMVRDRRYEGRDWTSIENDVRTDWETRHPGTWDRFRDRIRSEWERRVYSSGTPRRP